MVKRGRHRQEIRAAEPSPCIRPSFHSQSHSPSHFLSTEGKQSHCHLQEQATTTKPPISFSQPKEQSTSQASLPSFHCQELKQSHKTILLPLHGKAKSKSKPSASPNTTTPTESRGGEEEQNELEEEQRSKNGVSDGLEPPPTNRNDADPTRTRRARSTREHRDHNRPPLLPSSPQNRPNPAQKADEPTLAGVVDACFIGDDLFYSSEGLSPAGSYPKWDEGHAGTDEVAGGQSTCYEEQGEVDALFDTWDE